MKLYKYISDTNNNEINYKGASIILENYLDGAIADYENGDVENDDVIMSSIFALSELGDSSWIHYYNRMNKIKNLRGNWYDKVI